MRIDPVLGVLFSLIFTAVSLIIQMMFWTLRLILLMFKALAQIIGSMTAEARR